MAKATKRKAPRHKPIAEIDRWWFKEMAQLIRASRKHRKQMESDILMALMRVKGSTRVWPGRCYELACALVKEKIVPGRAAYGHWYGKVVKGTCFNPKQPFQRHGWVVVDDKLPGGVIIVDPTRWVFEGKKPYVYIGFADENYDEGGNRYRMARLGGPPPWDGDEVHFYFDGSGDAWTHIEGLLDLSQYIEDERYSPGYLTRDQIKWLANLAPQILGEHAREVFAWISKQDFKCFIPLDNWWMVMESHG